MSNNTVEIDGIEFDAQDLHDAIYEAKDENGNVEYVTAMVGDVVVTGDGYNDGEVFAANIEDVNGITRSSLAADRRANFWIGDHEDEIENAITSFVEHVEGISGFGSSNDVEVPDDHGADALVTYDNYLTKREMQALIQDDGVGVGEVVAEGDTQHVFLHDVRE